MAENNKQNEFNNMQNDQGQQYFDQAQYNQQMMNQNFAYNQYQQPYNNMMDMNTMMMNNQMGMNPNMMGMPMNNGMGMPMNNGMGMQATPGQDSTNNEEEKVDVELEIIKQKLIELSDNSSAFQISQENLFSIDFVEIIYKFCPYRTPIELLQALNFGDVEIKVSLSQLEFPRWTPAKNSSYEYDANGNVIKDPNAAKGEVDCTNWDTILTKLQKQAELEEADSGNWCLKLGFPNIRGYWKDKDQYTVFNAPLLFAPVRIQYTSIDDITITIKGRSFDINPSIATIVSIKKKMLFETLLFGPAEEVNLERILKGYTNLGFAFDLSPMSQPFDRCQFLNRQQLLSTFSEGLSCYITPTITIGLYDIYNNEIFWDFNKILQKDSKGLASLLEPKTNLMFNYKKFVDDFRTNDIYLFSFIDIIQQLCVGRSLAGNTLIQGPPGTGKSETICNILVNIVLNNKTALVVSSKKTALDVIVNRLGDYSPIACHMVTKRKEAEYFYQQFDKLYRRFIQIRAQMEDEGIDEVVNRATTEKLFEDIYEDYKISQKLFQTRVSYGSKEYTIKELIGIADPADVPLLEQNNIKTRDDIIDFAQKHQNDDTSSSSAVTDLLQKFSEFSQVLNPDLQVNLGYIQQLCDFLAYYNGYDKRLIVAAYIMDNQSLEYDEYEKLVQMIGNSDADTSEITTKQKKWLDACNNNDLFPLIALIESYYSVVSEVNSKYEVTPDVRLFASWYIFINPDIKGYIAEFNAKESKIEEKTEIYLDRVEESIQETKQLLDRFIFLKFISTVKKYGNEFAGIMRQRTAYNPKPTSAIIKNNYELLCNLFPIHICSVTDVPSLIPCEHNIYDYFVCDEASQVELEKALPSMYRGKKYIITGDTKQLQPTSVFKQKVEIKTSVSNNSKYAQDLSDAVKAASIMQYYESRASTNVMLNYHYRSTFSELIDFSNQVFYDRQLKLVSKCVPYQNPVLVHRVNGVWKNSCNLEECNAIYQRILELSQTEDYEKSLGVITFNATQQALIQERLMKSSSPRIKEWLERKSDDGSHIGIFVQNIENVQGDERDLILFSIGYDKTVSNYGSLTTQADGANRINVAITRAKDRLELFQSEDANQYRGTNSVAKGPKVFTSWIRWASNMSYACENKKIGSNALPNFVSRVHREIYFFIKEQLTSEYNIVYNQMQGTFFVNFAIFKNVTPVAAIFTQRDNWKSSGKFREEYVYRKLFFRNRKWKVLDLSELSWQTDPSYKNKISMFLQKLMVVEQNNNELKYSNSVNVEEMEDIFDKPMVEVDININDNPEEQVQEDQVDQSQSSGRTMSRR